MSCNQHLRLQKCEDSSLSRAINIILHAVACRAEAQGLVLNGIQVLVHNGQPHIRQACSEAFFFALQAVTHQFIPCSRGKFVVQAVLLDVLQHKLKGVFI
jgi:hypothetical protein